MSDFELIYRPYRVFTQGDGKKKKKFIKVKGKKKKYKEPFFARIKRPNNILSNNSLSKAFQGYFNNVKGDIAQVQIANTYNYIKKEIDTVAKKIEEKGEEILKNEKKLKDIVEDIDLKSTHLNDVYDDMRSGQFDIGNIKDESKLRKELNKLKEKYKTLEYEKRELNREAADYWHKFEILSTDYEKIQKKFENVTDTQVNYANNKYGKKKAGLSFNTDTYEISMTKEPDVDVQHDMENISEHLSESKSENINEKTEEDNDSIELIKRQIHKVEGEGEEKGKNGLYNTEIDKYMSPISNKINYYGCVSFDEVKSLLDKIKTDKFCFIFNIATTTDTYQKQHHWCAVNCDGYSVEFYDPLGHLPEKSLIKILESYCEKKYETYLKLKTNNLKPDQVNSSNCGWYCMRFLIARNLWNVPFDRITGFRGESQHEDNIQCMKDNYEMFGYI